MKFSNLGKFTTSFFIGVDIENTYFLELFHLLNEYIKNNKLEEIIELQNLLSLHITLCYFDKEYVLKNVDIIIEDIALFNKTKLQIQIGNIEYFNNSTGYLSIVNKSDLEHINSELWNKYSANRVLENRYSYIPHITIFKVKNKEVFKRHIEKVNEIIQDFLLTISGMSIYNEVYLYAVNSKFTPELQLIVPPGRCNEKLKE